jgi:hypothetical protein
MRDAMDDLQGAKILVTSKLRSTASQNRSTGPPAVHPRSTRGPALAARLARVLLVSAQMLILIRSCDLSAAGALGALLGGARSEHLITRIPMNRFECSMS